MGAEGRVVQIRGYERKVRPQKLIGLVGFMGSGKDSFAYGLKGWVRIAFADKVREVIEALDPWVPIELGLRAPDGKKLTKLRRLSELLKEADDQLGTSRADGGGRAAWDIVKKLPEVRRLLQHTGTEAGRNVLGPDVWTDAALPLHREYDKVVVTDVRFPNEAKRVKDLGGTLLRIIRPGLENPRSPHPSEMKILEIQEDLVISNDGTLEELWAKAELFSGADAT